MASLFLRSAAGRVLRRSIPRGSFPRNPDRFFSDGVGRIESKNSCPKHGLSPEARLEMAFKEFGDKFSKVEEATRSLLEQQKRLEKREQRQRVLSFILFPTLAAVWIFGPDKKGKLSEAH